MRRIISGLNWLLSDAHLLMWWHRMCHRAANLRRRIFGIDVGHYDDMWHWGP